MPKVRKPSTRGRAAARGRGGGRGSNKSTNQSQSEESSSTTSGTPYSRPLTVEDCSDSDDDLPSCPFSVHFTRSTSSAGAPKKPPPKKPASKPAQQPGKKSTCKPAPKPSSSQIPPEPPTVQPPGCLPPKPVIIPDEKKPKSWDSRSTKWRKEGNLIYVTATDNLSPAVRLTRFGQAYNCYSSAYGTADDDEERSSAAKNCATVMWKLGRTSDIAGEGWSQVKHYFKEALKYFNKAYRTGLSCWRPTDWCDNVLASCRGCWEELSGLVEDNAERMVALQEFVDYLPIDDMKTDCYMQIADYHFHRGTSDLGKENYKNCLHHMRECHFPMHEAMSYGSSIDSVACERLQQRFNTLQEDIIMQTGLSESMQSREIGDKLFAQVVMDEEVLSLEGVWDIIDWYKDSILKVRGLDLRCEAISLSRIGFVFERVLKTRYRAKMYLMKALELSQAIEPMNVTTEKWYQETAAQIETWQKQTVSHELDEKSKREAASRERIQPQIIQLNRHCGNNNIEFLQFVYSTFKPYKPDCKLELGEEPTKVTGQEKSKWENKLLQKAVIHYHPDRVNEEEHGLDAKVLCEEITKRLTKRYQSFKI